MTFDQYLQFNLGIKSILSIENYKLFLWLLIGKTLKWIEQYDWWRGLKIGSILYQVHIVAINGMRDDVSVLQFRSL